MSPVTPVVPDHELLRRIGGGSYGDVWLARTTVGTWRAVKVVFRDRFTDARPYEREFNGIQKFEPLSRSNEAFIDILQIGRNDAEGYFYYVMELADDASEAVQHRGKGEKEMPGEDPPTSAKVSSAPFPLFSSATYVPKTLAKVLLQRGRLPVSECLELGLTLNLGLAHLHKAGLIHRDIKPSNIIFVGGVPKLADIGLVIEQAEARSFVGTEGFIPPEGPNSPQADLYSLGKVLYEAGMGKDRKDFPEPYTQIAEAPDAAALLEFNAILLKACAANRDERYQSAEEMNADLALLQSGGSVRRQRKLAGQLRFVQRAGAIVTAFAAVIALGWWWQARQTREARRLGDENQRLANDKSILAEASRERLIRLSVANGVRLLDQGDVGAGLLWFVEALSKATNNAAETAVHRVRIQQALERSPRLLAVAHCANAAEAGGWSPDGKHFLLSTYTMPITFPVFQIQLRSAEDGHMIWASEFADRNSYSEMRTSADGKRLLVRSGKDARVLDFVTGHELFPHPDGGLDEVAFSPDARFLAFAGTNGSIHVGSAVDGTLVTRCEGHATNVTHISFSADGSIMASGDKGGVARIWRLPSGESIGSPLQFQDRLTATRLSPDGTRLLCQSESAGRSGEATLQLWDVKSGGAIGSPLAVPGGLYFAEFVPGGSGKLVVATALGEIEVRDGNTMELVYPRLKVEGLTYTHDFSPDGRTLAVESDGGFVSLLNIASGEVLPSKIFHHSSGVTKVSFSPDGQRLLTSGLDGVTKAWSLGQKSETSSLTLAADFRSGQSFWDRVPRGRTPGPIVVSSLDSGDLHLIDPELLREVAVLKPQVPGNELFRWTAGSTGRFWAAPEGKPGAERGPGFVDLWERRSDGFHSRQLTHPNWVDFLTFAENDTQLITFCNDWTVRVWRTADGQLVSTHRIPASYQPLEIVHSKGGNFWFRPDGKALLMVIDEKIQRASEEPAAWHEQLYDPFAGRWVGVPVELTRWAVGKINQAVFSPDGSRLGMVSDGHSQSGHIFDLRTNGLPEVHLAQGGNVLDFDWSPDGRRAITAGMSPEVKVWDSMSGDMIRNPMRIDATPARSGRWSADGRFIATRSDSRFVRVWDATTTEAVTPLLRHAGDIRWVCITPGNRLITASEPNVLRAWDLKPTLLSADLLREYAEVLSGRRLTEHGTLLPLTDSELEAKVRSLSQRSPELFQ